MQKKEHSLRPKRITIKDIAKYCDLSIGAVSSVLQNKQVERRLPRSTVKKVSNAVRKLGYIPDLGARRLRISNYGKTPIVMALLSSYEAPLNAITTFLFQMRNVIDSTPAISERFDVSISMEMFRAGHLREKKSVLAGNSFNAAIIANTTKEDDEFLSSAFLPYPNVLAGRRIDGYYGVVDPPSHGSEVAALFKKAGKKRLAVIYGTPMTQLTRNRVEGFVNAMNGDVIRVESPALNELSGYETVRNYLAKGVRFDGLFCVTDSFAMGAYRAIKEFGLRIPQDVGVIGIGDYSYADYFDPPLTTVGVINSEFAYQGSMLLIKQITGELKDPEIIELKVNTIERASL